MQVSLPMLLSYAMDRKEVLMKTKLLKMTMNLHYSVYGPYKSLTFISKQHSKINRQTRCKTPYREIENLSFPSLLLSLHSPLPTQTQHYKNHREKYVANKPRFSNIIFINTEVMPLATRRTNRFPYDPHVCDSWSVSWLVP